MEVLPIGLLMTHAALHVVVESKQDIDRVQIRLLSMVEETVMESLDNLKYVAAKVVQVIWKMYANYKSIKVFSAIYDHFMKKFSPFGEKLPKKKRASTTRTETVIL